MPKLPDFEDQTQDEFKERQRAQGDIKDLYAYYRLSDHELTVIKLKEKQYNPKTPAYFEGHMNFVFVDSNFKKPFYFGVEGERLEGDDRGTEENPESFPPYGNNVIRFEGCTFEAPFEIQGQCMAMFVGCTFTPDVLNVLIKDQSQAEFIGCTLNNIVKAADHSELRFRNCDFKVCGGSYIELENSSTCNVSGGTMATPAISIIKATTDCDALLHGVPSVQANAITMDFSDHSRGRFYDIESLQSIGSIALYADNNSKIECRNIELVQSLAEDAIAASDHSEVYCDKVGTIQSLARIAVNLSQGSIFRGREGDVITSVADDAISATDESSVTVFNVTSILSQPKIAIRGEDSHIRVNQVESIVSQADNAVKISGTMDSQFIDVDNITSQAEDALVVSVGHKVMLQRVTHVVSEAGAAVSVSGGAEYIDRTGEDRTGLTDGITAQGSYVTVREVTTIEATEGVACTLIQTGVNLDKITDITGKAGGLLFEDGSGVIREVDTIAGDKGIGVDIKGVSAPTELTKISSITSENDKAFKATGDLAQLRVGEIDEISSPQADSLTVQMASGSCFFKDIQTITSKQAMAMVIDVQGGIFKAVDIPEVSANMANALDITVASKAKAELRDFASVTSQMGVAVKCDVAGTLQCFDFGTIESQQGKALEVVGSEEADIYFRDVTSPITSQQAEACDVVLSDRAIMAMRSIQGLESTQSVPLNVVASDSSRFYAVSFLSECTTTQETTWNLTASDDAIIDIRKAQGVSSTEGNALAARASDTSSVYLENVGDFETTTGGTVIIVASDTGAVTLENNGKVESTDGEALNITASGASTVTLRHMDDVKSVSQAAAVINASDAAEVKFLHLAKLESTEGAASEISTTGTAQVELLHLDSIESTEGNGLELNIGAGTELFVDHVPTVKSDQGVAVNGTASGRVVVHHSDSVETSEGQAIVLEGGGAPESFVEFKDIGTITGSTPSADLIAVTAGHIRFVNIPTVSVDTSSRYVFFLRSNGPLLGKIELIDVVNITASECRGVLYIRDCTDYRVYCTSQKGTISSDTGVSGVFLAVYASGYIQNYASIENSDGTMRGVYAYVCGSIQVENVDSIKGRNAFYSYNTGDVEIIDCPSLSAPDSGETAVYITVPVFASISGRQPTVIEAKDQDTNALDIRDSSPHSQVHLHDVTVSPSKGKTYFKDAHIDAHGCKFNGSTTMEQCDGFFLTSEFTCGLSATDSRVEFADTVFRLGQNDGPDKDLTISNCVISFVQGEITGDENVSITDSVFEVTDTDQPLKGAEDWEVSNCVLRGTFADWDANMNASQDSVLQFVKTDFTGKDISLSGGNSQVLTGHLLSCKAIATGTDSAVVLVRGTASQELTVGADNGVLGVHTTLGALSIGDDSGAMFNYLTASGTGLFGTGSAAMVNQGTIEGAITLNHDLAFLANNLTAGNHITTGNDLGILANRTSVAGNLGISSRCGSVLSKLDVTGSMTVNTDGGLTVTKGQVTGPLTIQQNCGSLLSAIAASSSVAVGASGSTFVNKGSFVGPVTFGTDCAIALSTLSISGTTTFDSGSGILGLRLDASGGAEIGDASGVIGARSSGALTGADDSGVIFARYGSDITLDTATVGVIGARMPSAITLGDDGAMVVASGSEVADAGASIVADCNTATGKDMVIVRGETTTLVSASNAFTVGGSSVTGIGANVLSLGTTSPGAGGSEGGVAIGGTGAIGGTKGALSIGMDGSGTINQSVVSSAGGALSVGGSGSGKVDGGKGSALIGTDLASGTGSQLHVGGSKNVSGGAVLTCGIYGNAGGTRSVTVGTYGADTISGESVSVGATSVTPAGSNISCVVLGNQWLGHDPEFGGSNDGAGLVLDGGATGSPLQNMNSGFFATKNCARAHNELGDDDVGCGTSWGNTSDVGSSAWGCTSDMFMTTYRQGDIRMRSETNIDIEAGYGYQDSGDLSLYAGVGSGSTGNILSKAQGSHSSLGYTAPTHGTF